MKNTMIKLIAAILTVLMLTAPAAGIAEEEALAAASAEKTEAPKAEAPKAEAPKAEEKVEAPKTEAPKAEEKAEAPKTEAPKAEEKAEAPKAEEKAEEKPAENTEEKVEAPKAEEPVETEGAEEAKPAEAEGETAGEATPAGEAAPAQAETAEKAATTEAAPAEAKPTEEAKPAEEQVEKQFEASISVKRAGSGTIYYDDTVTLKAVVNGANMNYDIRWEANVNGSWKVIKTGSEYTFTVTRDSASYKYRAVAIAEKQAGKQASSAYELPEVFEREPEVEEPVIEEPVVEEPAIEEPVIEEPIIEEPATEEPATEEPVVEEPIIEEPATEEPATEEPVVEEPIKEKPVAVESNAEEASVESEEEEELYTIPDAYETPLGGAAVMAASDADVRIAADGMSEIFITLPEGTDLNVVGIEGDWVAVEIGDQIGYIYKDDIEGIDFEAMQPQPDSEQAQDPEANRKITIFTSRRSVMSAGETVRLTSKVEGFDGYELMYQWECDKGNGFQEVKGANSDSYSFEASAESLSWNWRLAVYYR